jgi:hypothetical protein
LSERGNRVSEKKIKIDMDLLPILRQKNPVKNAKAIYHEVLSGLLPQMWA